MSQDVLVERFFETLISGDRTKARAILEEVFDQNTPVEVVITGLMFPTHEMIERLYKADQLTTMCYHFSTRLLRMLVDQVALRLPQKESRGQTIFAVCGPSQGEELAAQMAVDLLESRGFTVSFAGGGLPADEIIQRVNEERPNYLLMFAAAAADLPEFRRILDNLRANSASPHTQAIVGGGVFNRAEGLAEEIGLELFGNDPIEIVELLTGQAELPPKRASQPAPAARTRTRKAA